MEDIGNNLIPLWSADGLYYLRGTKSQLVDIDVMHIPVLGAEPQQVCRVSLPANPEWGSYDPTTGRFAYTFQRAEADIYLAQPATGRGQD